MTDPAPDAGLSTWWPTPARPSDHFGADELERSTGHHRPLRRIRLGLAAGQVLLLLGAASVLVPTGDGDRLADAGPWTRSLVAAAAVVVALRLPESVARWRVARLPAVEPIDSGSGPVASTVAGAVVPLVVLTVVARVVLDPLTDPRWGWPLVLVLAAALVAIARVATGRRAGRAQAVEAPEAWVELVERAGINRPVGFGLLDEDDAAAAPNACAMASGGRSWILVDPSLVGQDPAGQDPVDGPLAEFVVAHEITHLASRHPEVQLVLQAITVVVGLGTLPALSATGWPWDRLGLTPGDPRSLPVAVLVVLIGATLVRLPVAWVLRALERAADRGAVELVGPPPRSAVKALHLGAGGELAPPRWSSLLSVRPAPAERLEYLERCRRSVTPRRRPHRASTSRPVPERSPDR